MFSVAPNIVLAPNMTQNANTEHKHCSYPASDASIFDKKFLQRIRCLASYIVSVMRLIKRIGAIEPCCIKWQVSLPHVQCN